MSEAKTRVVGLTGGIGSGKSAVAAILRQLGHPVIDADALAREVVEPGQPAYEEIVHAFGRDVLQADGRIDRKRLAARVFADDSSRTTLNSITHPRIAAAAQQRLLELRRQGAPLVFYEAALLVENGLHRVPGLLDALCVVALPEPEQVRRALLREGEEASEEDVRRRIAAQLPLDVKIAAADYLIDNRGSLDATRGQVQGMLADLLSGGPRRPSRKA